MEKGIAVKINKGEPNQRTIGILYPKDKIFHKNIYGSKHIFKVLNAIGVDAKYFTDVLLPQNYTIKVFDNETGVEYNVESQKMRKYGQHYHFKKETDDKAQIFLPLRYWNMKIETSKELTERLIKNGDV
jgi:hypothetical protein